jgi:hypothetical protein
MDTTGKIVAVVCIFSTLFMGCYNSALIDPTGDEKVKMYSGSIESVLTKDGKKYEFERPPVVTNDTIAGGAKFTWYTQANQEVTSIPLSNVALRRESHSGNIEYVVTKAGAKYTYEEPPAVVDRVVVGKATFTGYMSVDMEQVSIPLSDVAECSVSEFNGGLTMWAIFLGVAAVAGIIAATFPKVAPGPII